MADRRGTLEDLGKLIQENGIHMTEWTKEMWQEFCTFYKGKKYWSQDTPVLRALGSSGCLRKQGQR